MKKNISINISGIIFNIEEDGYEHLKGYLDEIKRYFDTYDDSGEIAADIENRVAEIFLSKLSPQKQVITAQDVENLKSQMGNIQDFEAIEEPEEPLGIKSSYQEYAYTASGAGPERNAEEGSKEYTDYEQSYTGTPPPQGKRFYRDGSRKVLGGVAAGIAGRLGIDPLWIRLLFVIILLDLFISTVFSSTLLLCYIMVWIIVPERKANPNEKKVRKVFRNPDDRIIGGVAGGLAAYFGIDPVLIRILFFASIFFAGSGVVAYFVLWLIMPEAKTLTDRMQMQGEPLTLSNIEQNIKKNLNFKDRDGKGPAAKAVLFPFRLVTTLIEAAVRAIGQLTLFLANVLRTISGLVLLITGFAFLLALFIALGFATGIVPEFYLDIFDLHVPEILAQQNLPPLVLGAAFTSLFIPGLAIMLLGIAALAKKWVIHAAAGWLIFVLWLISLICLAITLPPQFRHYQQRNFHEARQNFPASKNNILFLNLTEEANLDNDLKKDPFFSFNAQEVPIDLNYPREPASDDTDPGKNKLILSCFPTLLIYNKAVSWTL